MNVTDIWTRRDGRWQIVRRHATVRDDYGLQHTVASERQLTRGGRRAVALSAAELSRACGRCHP